MKALGKAIIVACLALVAGGTMLVYAYHDKAVAPDEPERAEQTAPQTAPQVMADSGSKPEPDTAAGGDGKSDLEQSGASSSASKQDAAPPPLSSLEPNPNPTLYDINSLPPLVQRMLGRIVKAAQSGKLDDMRPVLESNEIKPLVAREVVPDPVEYWRTHSADGTGRDILAAMLNVFASGYSKSGSGSDVMYIWPYFATRDLTKLTPDEQVDLYRIVPADHAAAMLKSGKYDYFRAGIGADGVWHFFLP